MSGGVFWGPYYSSDRGRKTTTTTEDPIMPVEIDNSSGLHVFELHMPSVGVSFFALIFALIAIGFAYGLYLKCCSGGPCCGSSQQQLPVHHVPAVQQDNSMQPLLQVMALQAMQQQALQQRPISPLPLPPVQYNAGFETARIVTLPEDMSATSVGVQATPSSPTTFEPATAEHSKKSRFSVMKNL